jgi:hypothetical protein
MEADVSASTRPSSAALTPVSLLVLLAALALGGALLWWVMDALSRSDVSGSGWSLRGNGALIVALVGGPMLLAVGWAMLAVWFKGPGVRFRAGLLAGSGTLILSIIAGFGPVLARDWRTGLIALPLACATGLGLAAPLGHVRARTVIVSVAGLAVALGLGVLAGSSLPLVAPLFVPVMVAIPLAVARDEEDERLASAASRPLRLLAYLGVPAAVIAGFVAANALFAA